MQSKNEADKPFQNNTEIDQKNILWLNQLQKDQKNMNPTISNFSNQTRTIIDGSGRTIINKGPTVGNAQDNSNQVIYDFVKNALSKQQALENS